MNFRILSLLLLCGFVACSASLRSQSSQGQSSQGQSNNATPVSPGLAFQGIHSSIEVHADDPTAFDALAPAAHITQQQLESAAGTYGDFTRYLQTLPGVVWNSDLSNEILVRGGHPVENLYVVDGIEVPNINHFSLAGSNGGFTSMIDTSTIGSVDLRSGVYDSSYSSRLSSMIQIHTRRLGEAGRSAGQVEQAQQVGQAGQAGQEGELTLGISGAGGFYQRSITPRATLLLSAHQSIVSLVTQDIGINGVPHYTNALSRLEWSPNSRDTVSVLTLSGRDSISMHPCVGDYVATSLTQTEYSGWRSTEGLGWNHIFSAHLNSRFTASNSVTEQNIGQQIQSGAVVIDNIPTCTAATTRQTYLENTRDSLSALNYQLQGDLHGWFLSGGSSFKLISPNDRVQQPLGQQSPFSTDAVASDAIQIDRQFSSGQIAGFVQAEGSIGPRFKVLAGLRTETFAIVDAHAFEPRASIAYLLTANHPMHASWGNSSQLPPTLDLLSYVGNQTLRPVSVSLKSAGIRALQTGWGTLDIEAYRKNYRREAVSTEYPQLALGNMIDTLGQSFSWLPLASAGTAASQGLEVSLRAHFHNRLQLMTSATYSRTTYRALDKIQRPSNYDFPFVGNTMAHILIVRGFELDARETYSSGRVYTPYDLPDSFAQNRAIYDLPKLNGLRGPFYNRTDLEIGKRIRIHNAVLDLHGGADNIFNRRNLLGYVWMPNCQYSPECLGQGSPVARLPQMGLYPEFAVRYIF